MGGSDLASTLAEIDTLTAPACAWCTKPLGDSPSDDFCSYVCQQDWHAAKTLALELPPTPGQLFAALPLAERQRLDSAARAATERSSQLPPRRPSWDPNGTITIRLTGSGAGKRHGDDR